MTAIYAFASPASQTAGIAADDREGNSGQRADKICLLEDRWALGFFGSDVTLNAAFAVGQFYGKEGHAPHASPAALAASIRDALVTLSEVTYPGYEAALADGDISDEAWSAVLANSAGMVVIDTAQLSITSVDFGVPFPPESIRGTPVTTALDVETVHPFALSRAVRRKVPLVVGDSDLNDPRTLLERLVLEDRSLHRQVGNLGALIAVENGVVRQWSCLSDARDAIQQVHGGERLLGFSMTIVGNDG